MFETVLCTDSQTAQELLNSVNEVPLFIGKIQRSDAEDKTANGILVLSINPVTQSWTIFEIFESREICVLQGGENGRLVTQGLVI